MLRHFYFWKYFLNRSFFVNDKCGSFDPLVFPAIHALLFPDVVKLNDFFILVAQKSERQVVFLAEILMGINTARANAQQSLLVIRYMCYWGFA